jgi:hypothetical protein
MAHTPGSSLRALGPRTSASSTDEPSQSSWSISLGPPEGLRRHAFDHRVSSATSRSSVRRSASIAIERASPPRAHRLPRRRQACVFAKMRIPQGCTSNPQGLHVAFVCARCLLPRCGSCGRCCSPCSLPRHGPPARGPAAAGRVMEKVGPTAGRETEMHSSVVNVTADLSAIWRCCPVSRV